MKVDILVMKNMMQKFLPCTELELFREMCKELEAARECVAVLEHYKYDADYQDGQFARKALAKWKGDNVKG